MHGSSVVVGDETTKTSTNSNDHNQNHTHMSNGTTSKSAHSLEDEISPSQNLSEQCERVNKRVYDFLNRAPSDEKVESVQRMTRESLGVIEQALERYTLDELSFSYNGGKDCLVLLILYLCALHTHSQKPSSPPLPPTLRSIYIISRNPFPSVTHFVATSSAKYHLSLSRYSDLSMREAFAAYLRDTPQVRAIFVGTRRTDPHGGKLTHFDMTDSGWPEFMRIHPVIDWHYAEIWGFIKNLGVEYCELYDMGYTSLGGTDDTHPNPALAVRAGGQDKGEGEEEEVEGGGQGKAVLYRPAYELVEDEEERLGRDH